jgi:hypothetical protein
VSLTDIDAASQLYRRALEAPSAPVYFLKQLYALTIHDYPEYFNQYNVEEKWPECAWHLATEKGPIHRLIDRLILRHNIFGEPFKKVSLAIELRSEREYSLTATETKPGRPNCRNNR